MYLLKQSNSVYYSRVCSPKSLLNIGYPFDIKVSLLTKDRSTALLRNLYVSAIIKQSLLNQDPLINKNPLSFRQFKRGLDEQLENVRINQFKTCAYPIPALTTCLYPEQEKNNGVTDNGELYRYSQQH